MSTLKAKRILMVEDDLALYPLWTVIISRCFGASVEVEWAVSSEAAQDIMRASAKPFDLIIADIFLAGSGTGVEFLRSEAVTQSGAKTVLVSTAGQSDLVEHCLPLLPNTLIISKPLNVMRYERAISAIAAS